MSCLTWNCHSNIHNSANPVGIQSRVNSRETFEVTTNHLNYMTYLEGIFSYMFDLVR